MTERKIIQLNPKGREPRDFEPEDDGRFVAMATGLINKYVEDGQSAIETGRTVGRFVAGRRAGVDIQNYIADELVRALQREFEGMAVCDGV